MANPKSWNLWHGCHKYSEGCDNCYMFYLDSLRGVSEKSAEITRTKDAFKPLAKDSKGAYKVPSGFELSINMTSDTFLEEADEWRQDMWDVIRKRPDVIFYILTKRVGRILECLPDDWGDGYENVSLNISIENQKRFDERWPIFESIPAKHKGFNLGPLLGPVDITPALSSGQIEEVHVSGEGFGGTRPCMHEWIADLSRQCETYKVNIIVFSVGSVYIKNGFRYETGSLRMQTKWAHKTGLSRFYGRPHYNLYSPYDGHLLSDDELIVPVYNKNKCMECPAKPSCSGCTECGSCKDVVLVDADGNPVERKPAAEEDCRTRSTSLDDFR